MHPYLKNMFDRAVLVISIDAEQIWGYMDLFGEKRFADRYPGASTAGDRLLACLCAEGIAATWAMVGALTLEGMSGAEDPRLAGLPSRWTAPVPAGNEQTAPLWYNRAFTQRLLAARPSQEVALHGGLTHMIWTEVSAASVERELAGGLAALGQLRVRPRSFVFPRCEEAHHELLREYGFRCYRGASRNVSGRLGRTLAGSAWRAVEELGCLTPKPVWPVETLPGLWNLPASLWLYPMGRHRAKLVGLRTRLERVRRGIEAAVRQRGVFQLCLHPENLAESPQGFDVFADILELFAQARRSGDAEILTMAQVAGRADCVAARESALLPVAPATARIRRQ